MADANTIQLVDANTICLESANVIVLDSTVQSTGGGIPKRLAKRLKEETRRREIEAELAEQQKRLQEKEFTESLEAQFDEIHGLIKAEVPSVEPLEIEAEAVTIPDTPVELERQIRKQRDFVDIENKLNALRLDIDRKVQERLIDEEAEILLLMSVI